MKSAKKIIALFLALFLGTASAIEIEGVKLTDTIKSKKTGSTLSLNGAGIRTKFIFDIYVCALYLEKKSSNPFEILESLHEKEVYMHFLYDEVSKEKLVSGWNDGFESNHTEQEMKGLRERLNKFNAMFSTVKKGNTIRLGFLTDGTLTVQINKKKKGDIQGHDFQQALLKVWLGDEPVTADLKAAMLGQKTE